MKKSAKKPQRKNNPFSLKQRLLTSRYAIVFVLVVLTMGMLGSSLLMKSEASSNRVSNAPVLFIHGYINNPLCTGGSVSGVFANAKTKLISRGHTGPKLDIAYYACDTDGENIQTFGNPNEYFPSGAWNGGWGQPGGNTVNTDLRHISYQLAWYIHDTYSSKGQTVSIVAHSMGGLIARWALYQTQAGNPVFPPYLYVQDAVTISTPHLGINDGYNNISWCPGYKQCQQMLPNSDFIAELNAQAKNPQATGSTAWTNMGSAKCDTMPAATSTGMGDVYKVTYTGSKPKCYNHTNYLTDVSDALDMPVQFRNPGDSNVTTISNGAHSLAWVSNAIIGNYPISNPDAPSGGNAVADAVNNLLKGLFGN